MGAAQRSGMVGFIRSYAVCVALIVLISLSISFSSGFWPPLPRNDAIGIFPSSDDFSGLCSTTGGAPLMNSCWLSPSWGDGQMESHYIKSGCVGSAPDMPTTNATGLTCPNNNGKNIKPCGKKKPAGSGFTIGLLYYASPALLRLQLQSITSYPAHVLDGITLLIVDDGSPPGLSAIEYVTSEDHKKLRIIIAKIHEDLVFNIGGARNLVAHLADTKRMLLLDLDTTVPVEVVTEMVAWETLLSSGEIVAHKFNRIRSDGVTKKIHPAVTYLDVASYWSAGGCDEDFVGSYGYTDPHFWYRFQLNQNNKIIIHKDVFLVEHEKEPCNTQLLGNDMLVARCNLASQNLAPMSKNRTRNRGIINRKKKSGCWSNWYLRFNYSVSSHP